MISRISMQNNVQTRPAFGARQVTGKSSQIKEIEQRLFAAKSEGTIEDSHILQRADSYANQFKRGISTYILGVNKQADVLRKYDVVQGNAEKYMQRLQRWCGHIVDLSKPPQQAEDLLKEMQDPRFDYSKI